MKICKLVVLVFLMAALLVGCATTKTVSRIDSQTVTDLSGRWNDTDSRLVAEQMVTDLVYRSWLSDFMLEMDKKPAVIVGNIRNMSSEHIQTATFIKDIERELINSGKVKFVATSDERKEIRNERDEQQTFASEETAKAIAQETGADFMMKGTISSITDAVDGKAAVFYQIDLELINIESNEKVWIGSKEIKKFIAKGKTKW